MEEFEEEEYSNKRASKGTWKKIFKTLLGNKKALFGLLFTVILLATIDTLYPLLNGYAIDVFFDNLEFSSFPLFVTIYLLFAVGYFISVGGFLLFASKLEVYTSYELKKQAYNKLQQLSFSYFDQTPQGWIMARMTSDSRKLSSIISWGIVDFLWGILNMVGILVVLYIKNWKLALIITATLPILVTIAYFLRVKILGAYRNARKINSKMTAAYNEGFMGIKTSKTLVIEDENKDAFHNLATDYKKSAIKAVIFSSLFGPTIYLLGYVAVAATLYTGANMYLLGGAITVGGLYVFIDYTIRFFDPVMSVSQIISDFQQAQASAERIISLIETEPEIKDSPEVISKYGTVYEPKKENWEELLGEIEFKDVTFKYNKGETVLKNFNLHINKGQSVALVGHTGSGKSTIVNLICRFYEPTSGEILIDGKDYKERSVSWLHSNLGYVLQTPELFSGSIKDNVRYGKLDATDEEIIEACRIVNAHEFISKMDKGYDTLVGEGGNRLSLGEKQLISFARAIIANPRILVLDEATSSIDTETEYLIQEAINKLLEGRTSFIIAHRLSTIVNSDLILVLKDGEVVESGNHSELLAKKGYYFNLYKNQFKQEMEDKTLI